MHNADEIPPDDTIDFAELLRRLKAGVLTIAGLAFIGIAAGTVIGVVVTTKQTAVSTMRVAFGFPGFERGNYPNGSKFQPDDIRAPDIINEAIKRLSNESSPALSTRIRGAIGITGFVSNAIVKERDRLRASGQDVPPYVPEEYEISLSLPRDHPLTVRQRELLLAEIVNVYLDKFRRTYVELPPEFGNTFSSLTHADFVEYELILTKEMQSLTSYLEQKINVDRESKGRTEAVAKQFRSPTNNLSFQDLLKQSELFTQIRLIDVLSQVYVFGLSKDRKYALVKMDYYLRTLEDQEQRLLQEESMITSLLSRTQERAQNYVLAAKSQMPMSGQPMLDQGFIDTLLANDAYNFLIRRALDAGLAVRRIQADKARMTERRQRMESFTKGEISDQAEAIANTQRALTLLENDYKALLANVRVVLDDYAHQEYADAIRISMQPRTTSFLVGIMISMAVGCITGLALGIGLSLLKPARA